ncbi:MAG: class I SAM-dependent methyltransferase [Acidobacteriota bacterium]
MDETAFRRWNEAMVEKYNLELYHARAGFLVSFVEGCRKRRILEFLQPEDAEWVLDVGCGAGHLLAAMPRGRLLGLDISHTVLRWARRRLGPPVTLHLADAARLPIATGTVDKVCCSEVLEHVLDPSAVLSELARIVKPTGVVVVSFPNEPLINRLKAWLPRSRLMPASGSNPDRYTMPERMDEEWHLHSFDLRSFRSLVDGVLRVEVVRAVPWAWLPIRYVVRCRPGHATDGPTGPTGGRP